jgi:uncharacterized cofD-like protein
MEKLKIVSDGGGGGQHSIAAAMRLIITRSELPIAYTAIVGVHDNGGSSGARRDYHTNGCCVGDMRRVAAGLLPQGQADEFEARDADGIPRGQLTLERYLHTHGDLQKAMDAFCSEYELPGRILPATLSQTDVHVRCRDGATFSGESEIYATDVLSHGGVQDLWLDPHPNPNPEAVQAITEADAIIICPGTLLCSILPTILAVRDAMLASKGHFICFPNLFNRRHHVDHRATVDDHLNAIEDLLRPNIIGTVCLNTRPFPEDVLSRYGAEAKTPSYGTTTAGRNVIGRDLVNGQIAHYQETDVLSSLRTPMSHHPQNVARVLHSIFLDMLTPDIYQ